METRQVLRPLGSLAHAATFFSSSSSSSSSAAIAARSPAFRLAAAASRRHQSTTSRTKKMLRIPPHPDFLKPPSEGDRIIFNPPSAAPSVYHTPFKFLPKSDPRRQAGLTQLLRSSSPSSSSSSPPPLPPVTSAAELRPKKYHLTRDDVEEMRRLRSEDPETWSVVKLASKFECSQMYVMMVCRASREHTDREFARKQAIKARWGPLKAAARQDRDKRRILVLQGQL